MESEKEMWDQDQPEIGLVRLFFSCMVAGGVQYGWALQLSLLTPYVQTLGLPHSLASIVWLCGPIAGLIVGPTVGLWSDRCRSCLGRRRPFILIGSLIICLSVLVIGYSSDIGAVLGDEKKACSAYAGSRWKADIIYVVGFWMLDFSNNTVQGPARAMMADLSGKHGCSTGNFIYAFWMAFGNILGYSSGATRAWHKWFPFLMTDSCCEACANLKGAFLVAVVFLLFCLTVTLISAKEAPIPQKKADKLPQNSGIFCIFEALRNLPRGMPSVLLVTSLTWLAWFPFILYNTDWMGREIFHGDPSGTKQEIEAYDEGVQQGAFGLLLNSIVLGISSILLAPLCRKYLPRIVWVMGNFTLFFAMIAVASLSINSRNIRIGSADSSGKEGIKMGALAVFTALGFPLAILYSIPFASAAQLAANEGGTQQGLVTGVLNISIVVPQVIVALCAGPWDGLFGKSNMPAFALAGAVAIAGVFVGLVKLPRISNRYLLKNDSFDYMH